MERDEIEALLEMHLHGELPPALRKKAERVLATPEGRRRLEEIRASDRRILEELPPDRMAASIRRKSSTLAPVAARKGSSGLVRFGWGAGAALAAMGIALFAVVERPADRPAVAAVDTARGGAHGSPTATGAAMVAVDRATRTVLGAEPVPAERAGSTAKVALVEPLDDGIRTKGGAPHRLRLHLRRADGGVVSLRDGDTVPKAAVLQVSLANGPLLWAAVVSVDGAGQATLHLPEVGDSAAHLDEEVAAPHSFQLDESPGFERFFLIASTRRFSLDEALALVRRSGRADPVRKGWNLESLRVVKP